MMCLILRKLNKGDMEFENDEIGILVHTGYKGIKIVEQNALKNWTILKSQQWYLTSALGDRKWYHVIVKYLNWPCLAVYCH